MVVHIEVLLTMLLELLVALSQVISVFANYWIKVTKWLI